MRNITIVVLVTGMLHACSPGSGVGLDSNGRPIGEAPDPGDQPTLPNIQARIFTPNCVQCHVGASAPEGLRLDAANAFGDLVGVPSQQVGSLNRVEPSDATNSYLYQKITGTAAVGGRMPLGGPALPNEDIELIRQWIDNGASPTATASKPGALVSAQRRYADGQPLVRVGFSSKVDPTSALMSSFSASSPDGRPIPILAVRMVPSNPFAVDMLLDSVAYGDAIIRINDNTTTLLQDLSGYSYPPEMLWITSGEVQW